MIYLPHPFEAKDDGASRLIRENPFATVIAIRDGEPVVSHLPLLLGDREDGRSVIEGHLAIRNPQSQIPDGTSVTAIFHGPHAYITPKWYAENDVPTWNYAVVHVTGKLAWVREAKPLITLLRRMTDFFEARSPDPWSFFLPDDLRKPEDLTAAIVGFEITVEAVQAKFKLSQNRSASDQSSVIHGLRERLDTKSHEVAKLMEGLE